MKILFITHTDSLGGANQALLLLLKGIRNLCDDFEFEVIMPEGGDEFSQELISMECSLLRFKFFPCVTVSNSISIILNYLRGRLSYGKIYKRIRHSGIDIIHTNSSICDLGIYLSTKLGVPHVWHIREVLDYYDMKLIFPGYYKKRIESANNHVVCISNYIKDYIDHRYRRIDSRVLYDGFIIPQERKVYYKDENKNNILIAGMIYKNKGQIYAIEALSILVNKYLRRDVFLYIVGTQSATREYEKQLMDYVQKHGLEQYVKFLPFTNRLDDIRGKCNIALQCSIMEGFGLVTIESMLRGLLVIGARSGATSELIDDGLNGWLYEPGNADDLAERINYVLDYDENDRVRRYAYNWAKDNFDNNKTTSAFVSFYKEILKRENEHDV